MVDRRYPAMFGPGRIFDNPPTWRPDPDQPSVPSGPRERVAANLAALRLVDQLEISDDYATPDELRTLAAWSGWGAVPQIFDDTNTTFADERRELRGLLGEAGWDAAARTTINAHYTDPAYVAAIWQALQDLGFTGGRVLEPGCGSGTFIGLAPVDVQATGVELDPNTARIAAQLYPDAEILAESFADTRITGGFDAVVGNVPFADVTLTDPAYNGGGHTMHNHFLIKSLAMTKPGGLVAALTSRYTLDATNPAARRELATLGDLVGAVRLPTGAHRRTAGTDVVTDLLILRRREPGRPVDPNTERWLDTTTTIMFDTNQAPDRDPDQDPGPAVVHRADRGAGRGVELRVNPYFVDNPGHVLGQLAIARGQYREELVVEPSGPAGAVTDVSDGLRRALAEITAAARDTGLAWAPHGEQVQIQPAAEVGGDPTRFLGHLTEPSPGTFTMLAEQGPEPVTVPRTQADELRQLLQLRDQVSALLQAEAGSTEDSPEIEALRAALNTTYDSYLRRFGPLNRFTARNTGRLDADAGEPIVAQVRPPVMRIFREDPFAHTVAALENFDPATQAATKAAIFTQRVVARRTPRLGADTPADALAICLDTHGSVQLDQIAFLLGVDEPQARTALTGLVYDDPNRNTPVPAAEYLSGDVRAKLDQARTAAIEDPRYGENVTALQKVLPVDLGPAEIDARLGAAWIGAADVQAFLRETLNDRSITVEHDLGASWRVRGGGWGLLSTSTWGTERMPAGQLAERLLRQSTIRVLDVIDDDGRGRGRREVLNPVETEAAIDKAQELSNRFGEWVWEDPARADRLATEYNRRFNSIVLRSYDTSHMSLPGLSKTFTPRPHQLAAVARMVAEPNAGLFHEVGAGKTAEMTIGVMELRRLGLVRKPAIVVPNHMLRQFSTEFLQLYPQANILAAGTEDLAGDKRRAFVAKATTGDWDAVIMTRTAFERLPVSPKQVERYLSDQIEPLRDLLARRRAAGDGTGPSVKRIEKQVLAAEERIKAKLLKGRDPGVTFEETGIDYLCIDELHDYKNLLTPSNIEGASIAPGSVRATDLHMKVEYLRSTYGGRAITGATATPIANSVAEAYVMQRYLRPDLLAGAGLVDLDTWAGTFGETTTEMELSPDGSKWRLKTRFAKFRNIPEFLKMWHVAADVKTAEDLNLPTPDLAARDDDQRAAQTIVVAPSAAVVDYVKDLGERADRIRMRAVDPDVDNMLKVSGDGRKAALDMRLITGGEDPDGEHLLTDLADTGWNPTPSKVEVAAERIARIWAENADQTYLRPNGLPHDRPGALQLVFCDLGTPRQDWNVYDELRHQLVERGVPNDQIAYMHQANNDREKHALFEAARTGVVQVLLGSTAKMGVGTNVQARAVALHHLDCPWRPADLAQREGRILRQGNQNPEVQIYRYVTEGTFDSYSWQTVARKARFIAQVMQGRLDSREIEDIGDAAMSYDEVKALASGDPLILEKAKADAEVSRLRRLERAHSRQHQMLRHRETTTRDHLADLRRQLPVVEAAIAQRTGTRGEAFRMRIGDHWFTERAVAAQALGRRLGQLLDDPGARYRQQRVVVGELGGHQLFAEVHATQDGLRFLVHSSAPTPAVVVTRKDIVEPAAGLAVRFENNLRTLESIRSDTLEGIDHSEQELGRAAAGQNAPFAHAGALAAAVKRQAEIAAQMAAASEAADAPPPAGQGTQPAPALGSRSPADQRPVSSGPDSGPDSAPDETAAAAGRVRTAAEALKAHEPGTHHPTSRPTYDPDHRPEPRHSDPRLS